MTGEMTEERRNEPCPSATPLRVSSGPLNVGGAKRLAKLIKRYGILKSGSCHECGAQLEANDAHMIAKDRYRYSIGCNYCDNLVMARSVRQMLLGWQEEVENSEENVKDLPRP